MAQNKVRLAKKEVVSNGNTEVELYTYDSLGRIKGIAQSNNGKLISTISEFVFNKNGLVVSYKKTPAIKTFPERVTIVYDDNNRMSTFEINGAGIIAKRRKTFRYSADSTIITESPLKKRETILVRDADSNIIIKQSINNGKPGYTISYTKFDGFTNAAIMLGGFIEEDPFSKHNCLQEEYFNGNSIKRLIEYEKILVSKYIPGGPKIPTQYRNGLPLKISESSFDRKTKTEVQISLTTYQYIKL